MGLHEWQKKKPLQSDTALVQPHAGFSICFAEELMMKLQTKGKDRIPELQTCTRWKEVFKKEKPVQAAVYWGTEASSSSWLCS